MFCGMSCHIDDEIETIHNHCLGAECFYTVNVMKRVKVLSASENEARKTLSLK